MTIVVWIAALVAAATHILVFVWESLLIARPGVHQRIFAVPSADVPAIRLWTFGLGFYNLFLGLGLVIGVAAWGMGSETVGRTLIVYICAFMVACSLVLLVADRMAIGRPRGAGITGVFAQGGAPLVALIALLW